MFLFCPFHSDDAFCALLPEIKAIIFNIWRRCLGWFGQYGNAAVIIITFVLFLTPGNVIMIFVILILIVDVGGISCFSPCLVSLRGSLSRHCLAEMCHFGIPIIRPISFLFVLNSKESLFVCDPFCKERPYLSQGRYFAKRPTSSERYERPCDLQRVVYRFFAQDFLFKGA